MGEDAGPVSFGIASLFGRSGRAAKTGGTGKSGGRGRSGRRSRAFRIGLVFAVLLVVAALIPAGFGAWLTGPVRDGAIARGVHAAGVDISGLTPPDAARRLESSLPSLDHSVVTARAGDHELKLTARQFGASWSVAPAIASAMTIGREADLTQRLVSLSLAYWKGRDFAVPIDVRRATLIAAIRPLARAVYQRPRNAGVVLGDPDLGVEGAVSTTPAHDGVRLDMAGSSHAIAGALLSPSRSDGVTVTLPLCKIKPLITEQMLGQIDGEVSEFTTQYRPWQRDRTHNLWLAASAINGAIIAPRGLFSYNRRVGQRKISKGYRSAPIFVKGKVVEDTGGGVCQVATTVYNAALLAACSVVERYHHSARTSYIGPGRDATVSWGSLDLKFRNSRKEPILLTTSMAGGSLTVRVWGHVHPGESVRVYTRDLPDGVLTYRVIHRPDGQVRRELVSSDPPQERAE